MAKRSGAYFEAEASFLFPTFRQAIQAVLADYPIPPSLAVARGGKVTSLRCVLTQSMAAQTEGCTWAAATDDPELFVRMLREFSSVGTVLLAIDAYVRADRQRDHCRAVLDAYWNVHRGLLFPPPILDLAKRATATVLEPVAVFMCKAANDLEPCRTFEDATQVHADLRFEVLALAAGQRVSLPEMRMLWFWQDYLLHQWGHRMDLRMIEVERAPCESAAYAYARMERRATEWPEEDLNSRRVVRHLMDSKSMFRASQRSDLSLHLQWVAGGADELRAFAERTAKEWGEKGPPLSEIVETAQAPLPEGVMLAPGKWGAPPPSGPAAAHPTTEEP
jgi:hypothetical protein